LNEVLAKANDLTDTVLDDVNAVVAIGSLGEVTNTLTHTVESVTTTISQQKESLGVLVEEILGTVSPVLSIPENVVGVPLAQDVIQLAFTLLHQEETVQMAALNVIQTQLDSAQAMVLTAQKAFFVANEACSGKSDQFCSNLLDAALDKLKDSLQRFFIIQEISKILLDNVQVLVGKNVLLGNIIDSVQYLLDEILLGEFLTVAELTEILSDVESLQIFQDQITAVLTGVFTLDDLQFLDFAFGDDIISFILEVISLEDIAVVNNVVDVVHNTGGVVTSTTSFVNAITSTIIAASKTEDVAVTKCGCPAKKRSTDQCYQVTIGKDTTNTVARATQENGMTATTATTSSASSLVFSFLIIFVSVLCFF